MSELSNVLPALFGELIPLAAIALSMGIAFWAMYLGHQRRRLEFDERRLMIEKGMTPPPIPSDMHPRSPQRSLRLGVLLLFMGIGFGLGGVIWQGPDAVNGLHGTGRSLAVAGAIVGFIGIGNLVVYGLTKNSPTDPSSLPPA